MVKFPSKGNSLWFETKPQRRYEPLANDTEVDVAIIGGGITGLTAAYLLKQQGKQVMVFEKQQIGAGVSGFTTGKVTSQHGITYSSLIKQFGKQVAQHYGEANQAAIDRIEAIINQESIDCGWRREDNYVFTQEVAKLKRFQQEAEDAISLGLPAEFTNSLPIGLESAAAVRFNNQATFHVGKYLAGLAQAVDGQSSRVYENSEASFVHDGTHPHFKVNSHTVRAKDIIIATNIWTPIAMHAAYTLVEYPARSYIVAGRTKETINGMYINDDKPGRSILPAEMNNERWLLVGGEGHIVGKSGPAKGHYDKLANYAQEHFNVEEIEYRWSTWDFVAYDSLPLIGRAYPWSRHLYTATGYRKWGLTNSMVAAMILADTITGKENPWAYTFRSTRLSALLSLPRGLTKGLLK